MFVCCMSPGTVLLSQVKSTLQTTLLNVITSLLSPYGLVMDRPSTTGLYPQLSASCHTLSSPEILHSAQHALVLPPSDHWHAAGCDAGTCYTLRSLKCSACALQAILSYLIGLILDFRALTSSVSALVPLVLSTIDVCISQTLHQVMLS